MFQNRENTASTEQCFGYLQCYRFTVAAVYVRIHRLLSGSDGCVVYVANVVFYVQLRRRPSLRRRREAVAGIQSATMPACRPSHARTSRKTSCPGDFASSSQRWRSAWVSTSPTSAASCISTCRKTSSRTYRRLAEPVVMARWLSVTCSSTVR